MIGYDAARRGWELRQAVQRGEGQWPCLPPQDTPAIVSGPREDYRKQQLWWTVRVGEWARYTVMSEWLLTQARAGAIEREIRYQIEKNARLLRAFDRQVREDRDF